jgi:large subunit ribosomal protein L23
MALFGKKKTENKEVKKVAPKSPAISKAHVISTSAAHVIIRPHITEKTGMLSQAGVYTFQVSKGASSREISEAIQVMYKVVPTRISVTTIRAKKRNLRGIPGMTASGKKAYVYLKKGDVIEFI